MLMLMSFWVPKFLLNYNPQDEGQEAEERPWRLRDDGSLRMKPGGSMLLECSCEAEGPEEESPRQVEQLWPKDAESVNQQQ